jgi:dTDP-glucose 4,6-dehydratase
MRILVTGGAGFIGSNFIRLALKQNADWQITNFDLLTYAGNPANLEDVSQLPNYSFIKGDIASEEDVINAFHGGFDCVINFAAETHVDRSLYDPHKFVRSNVDGAQILIEHALRSGIPLFIQVSTDEVYGSIEPGNWATENSPLRPSSPYAASKAAADLLCRSYYVTHNLPVIITRCCNNYGPYQFPEKLVPFFITRALDNQALPLYGDGLNMRDWLYVEDHCSALLEIMAKGKPGEIYNIGSRRELTNLEMTETILRILDKPKSLIKFIKDRPAHDRRYALDFQKISDAIGWEPKISFENGIARTVQWYIDKRRWWEDFRSGEYLKFYEKHYPKDLDGRDRQ